MYPAQALVDELYTVDDLPDEIFVISSLGNIVLPVDRSGPIGDRGIKYYYGDIGGEEISVSLNTDLTEARWLGSAEVDTIGGCLISKLEIDDPGGPTLDQFADTYTVASCSYAPVVGASVTRVSLCVWQGTYLDPGNPFADGPQNIYLIYCPGNSIVCGGEIFENGSGIEVPYFYSAIDIGGSGGFFSKKTPNSNTPAGNYSGEFSISFS